MGRAGLVIDYKKLQDEINLVEKDSVFTNYGQLCIAVNEYDTKLQPNGCCATTKHRRLAIHTSQVYQAISKSLVTCVTKPGKKGRQVGATVNRTSKAAKFASNNKITNALADIEKDTPEKYQSLVQQVKDGSMKAAVKLKCMRCCGFSGMHKSCNARVCDLLPFNLLIWPNRANSEDLEYDPMDKVLG